MVLRRTRGKRGWYPHKDEETRVRLILNGKERELPELHAAAPLSELVALLGFRQDRVAVELNHAIAPRAAWTKTALHDGDRVELVHFVGGGAGE